MKKFASQEIKEFVSKPFFNEKIILKKDPSYPKISIVTPSYNQAQFIERTILSILNQNYPNLEYIIIDGGSTDGSVEIIRKYEKYLAYWISEKDKGQSYAINKGFKMATGELIGWQNSDDIYLPETFRYVAELVKKKNYELIFGDIVIIDEEDRPIRTLRYGPWPRFMLKNSGMSFANQATFWARGLQQKSGPLREDLHYAFDGEFFYRLVISTKKIKHLPEVMACFRVQPTAKAKDIENYSKEFEIVKAVHKFKRGNVFLKLADKLMRSVYCLLKGNILYLVSPVKDAEKIFSFGRNR